MSIRLILSYALVFLFINGVSAQKIPDNLCILEGRVLSADSLLPIAKVHLISKFNRWGSISNDEGRFKMYASKYDSVLFTSMGFRPLILYVDDSVMSRLGENFSVYMVKDTIEINEVVIRGYYDYETFKQIIIGMDPMSLDQFYPDMEGSELMYLAPTPQGFKGPVQLMYDWLNKSARLERKLVKNRQEYNKVMMQMGRPNDTIPVIPEHMR